jgi:hypothetical protein
MTRSGIYRAPVQRERLTGDACVLILCALIALCCIFPELARL